MILSSITAGFLIEREKPTQIDMLCFLMNNTKSSRSGLRADTDKLSETEMGGGDEPSSKCDSSVVGGNVNGCYVHCPAAHINRLGMGVAAHLGRGMVQCDLLRPNRGRRIDGPRAGGRKRPPEPRESTSRLAGKCNSPMDLAHCVLRARAPRAQIRPPANL